MATDLCLPVLKYSHACGQRPDKSIPWSHLQASNLFAIITGKKSSNTDEQLTLRVVQSNKVLDTVEIGAFVESSTDARRSSARHGVTLSVDQLPIFGITKDALLALRYRPSDGQSRRIQLRFETPTACSQVVDAFVRRGMEFQDQRPSTARPGSSRPATDGQPERLLTANSTSPFFNAGSTAEASSLATHAYAPPRALQSQGGAVHVSGTEDMPPPPFLRRDEVAAPREVEPVRHTTAQMYRAFTTPSQAHPMDHSPATHVPVAERPVTDSHAAALEDIRKAIEAEATPPHSSSSSIQHQSSAPGSLSLPPLPTLPNLHGSGACQDTCSNARPATSATTLPAETYELPPRRELPFKRPDTNRNGSKTSLSSGTSAMSLPPLPKPKLVSQISSSSSRANLLSLDKPSSRPSTSSPLKRTFPAEDDRPATMHHSAHKEVGSPTKQPRLNESSSSVDGDAPRPSRMEQLLSSRKPLAERSSNGKVQRLGSLLDAPHEIVSPPRSPVRNTSTAPQKSSNAIVESQEPGTCSLGEYATQSFQDRQAVLEEFMISVMENPAFAKLCEDVENCWQRITLGL